MGDHQFQDTNDSIPPVKDPPVVLPDTLDATPEQSHRDVQPKTKLRKRKARKNTEQQGPLKIQKDGKPVVNNHYYFNNVEFKNSPFIAGYAQGNTLSCAVLPVKLHTKDAKDKKDDEKINHFNERLQKGEIISLEEILRTCNSKLYSIGTGCIELTLRVYSREGLDRLWEMFTSGELERRLKEDLPLEKVNIREQDYMDGRRFFQESREQPGPAELPLEVEEALLNLDKATSAYIQNRKETVDLLRVMSEDVKAYDRSTQLQKIACWTAGIIGVGLVIAGLLTSFIEFDTAFFALSSLSFLIAVFALKLAITTSRFLTPIQKRMKKIKDPFISSILDLTRALNMVGTNYAMYVTSKVKLSPRRMRVESKLLNRLESTQKSVEESMSMLETEYTREKESSTSVDEFISVLSTLTPAQYLRLQDHSVTKLGQSIREAVNTIKDHETLKKIAKIKKDIMQR